VTFSEINIVKFVQEHFVPVWESVSEVTTAIYDLGEGKEVRATMNGEIAIYFCRPDGKVFDIVPALQSPKVTYEAMKQALSFYQETGATDQAIRAYHQKALELLVTATNSPNPTQDVEAWKKLAKERLSRPGELLIEKGETAPMKKGVASVPTVVLRDPKAPKRDTIKDVAAKSFVVPRSEAPILIIQPRGINTFAAELHAALSIEPPKEPELWKKYIFEGLLGQSLAGGSTVRFDINSDSGSLSIIP
jgi:hypothetical protein